MLLWRESPRTLLFLLPVLGMVVSLHEFAHAGSAYLLGDRAQRSSGRISLNPLRHFEFTGFLALLLLGFGWGKPVQTNPSAFRYPRLADTLIALAGPMANLLTAFVGLLLLSSLPLPWPWLRELLGYAIGMSTALAVFNLLPIPPLDGSHLIFNLLPQKLQPRYLEYSRLGLLVLLGLIIADSLFTTELFPWENLVRLTLNFMQRLVYHMLIR